MGFWKWAEAIFFLDAELFLSFWVAGGFFAD
jgi:hypothetical protein